MDSSNNKLPVIKIFTEALVLPKTHGATLLRLGTPFLIVGALLVFIFSFYTWPDEPTGLEIGIGVLSGILYVFTIVMAIIGCHRAFLLNNDSVENTKAFRWSGRETRFIGWWIIIGFCSALIALPIMLILMPQLTDVTDEIKDNDFLTYLQMGVISVPIYYVASRWSLVLPATAIDERHKTLSWAWGLSSGNGWRLTLLIGFLPFTTDLIFNYLPEYESIIYSLVVGLAWIIVGVIEIGLLSLSYSFLSNAVTDDAK